MNKQQDKNRTHNITVQLLNKEGYFISFDADVILDLQIEDNLLRWWVAGYIDIKNEFDFMEKNLTADGQVADLSSLGNEPIITNPNTGSVYTFRNDGSDMLFVQFANPQTTDDAQHTMSYLLKVYKVEDLESDSQSSKAKRLYFHDEKYHQMLHTNLDWSTADEPNNAEQNPRIGFDEDREMKVGYAIHYLLRRVLGQDIRISAHWDEGEETILYTSPTNYRAIDDLNTLVRDYVSSRKNGGGKGILKFDRSYKMWRLFSLNSLFAGAAIRKDQPPAEEGKASPPQWSAGPLQQDKFLLVNNPTGEGETKTTPNSERTPSGGDNVYVNIHADESNTIQSLKFTEMTGTDNLEFLLSRPVHIHDNKGKKFYINQTENSLRETYQRISKLVDYVVHDPEHTATSMNISTERQYNTNISHSYSTSNTHTDPSLQNLGVNTNVFDSVMLSNTVEFTVPGEPWRQSGKFISIDPDSDTMDNKKSAYHNKVYGQYLVVSVVHRLLPNNYVNKYIAVKPYNHRPVHQDATTKKPETFETYVQSSVDTPSE